uniref:Uncharacterized protein n=2 Tax=Plectus sambesii TaxID=2011161 RepID=A0A914W8C4_9BILA
MDPKSAYGGHARIVAPCSLFVPTVKDSRVCGVCRFGAHEHLMSAKDLIAAVPVQKVRPIPCVYDVRAEYIPRHNFEAQYHRIPVALGQNEVDEILNGKDRRSSMGPMPMALRNSRQLNTSESSAFSEYKKPTSTGGGSTCETTPTSDASSDDRVSSVSPPLNIGLPPSLMLHHNGSRTDDDGHQEANVNGSPSSHTYPLFKYNTFAGSQGGLNAGPKPKPRLSLLSLDQPPPAERSSKSLSSSPGPALSTVSSNLSLAPDGRDREKSPSPREQPLRTDAGSNSASFAFGQQLVNGSGAKEESHPARRKSSKTDARSSSINLDQCRSSPAQRGLSSHLSCSSITSQSPLSPTSGDSPTKVQHKEPVLKAKNFRQILNRFQNASDRILRQQSVRDSWRDVDKIKRRHTVDLQKATSIDVLMNMSTNSPYLTPNNNGKQSTMSTPNGTVFIRDRHPAAMMKDREMAKSVEPILDKDEDSHAPIIFQQSTGQPLTITIPTPKVPRRRTRAVLPHSWQSAYDVHPETTAERMPERPSSIQSYSSSMLSSPISPVSNNTMVDIQIGRHPPQLEPVEFNQREQGYNSPVNKHQGKFGGSLRKILQTFDMGGSRPSSRESSATIGSSRSKSRGERPMILRRFVRNSKIPEELFHPEDDHCCMANVAINHQAVVRNVVELSPNHPKKKQRQIESRYNQMAMGHVNTLAFVADNFAEMMRTRAQPITKDQMGRLRFPDFTLKSAQPTLVKGNSLFFDASLRRDGQPDFQATLMIAPNSQYAPLSLLRRSAEGNPFSPPALFELEDTRGLEEFLKNSSFEERARSCKIIVMPRVTLWSFQSLSAGTLMKHTPLRQPTMHERDVVFILIQLLSALKYLQSDGIEEFSWNFEEFLLAYSADQAIEDSSLSLPRLVLVQDTIAQDHEESRNHTVPVCRFALRALSTLMHLKMDNHVPQIKPMSVYSSCLQKAADILYAERASSLTQAKNLLETAFWVQHPDPRSGFGGHPHPTRFDDEFGAKMWLDSERAAHVNRLVRMLIEGDGKTIDVVERYSVQFLLSSTPRSLCEASDALHTSRLL